jgi:hypothetical protein
MPTDTIKVWISSVDHMSTFTSISKEGYGWKKIFKSKKIPADFPYIKMFLSHYPVVFFSTGVISFSDTQLEFSPRILTAVKNVRNLVNQSFSLPFNELKAERYTYPDPFMKAFNISWVKIDFVENGKAIHYLISAESKFGVSSANKANDEIFEKIRNKIQGNIF